MERSEETGSSARSLLPQAVPRSATNCYISTLPASVFEWVVRFVVERQDPSKLYPKPFDFQSLHRSLAQIKLVSHEWLALSKQITAQWSSHVAYIDVNDALMEKPPQRPNPSATNMYINPSAVDLRLILGSFVAINATQTMKQDWYSMADSYDPGVYLHGSSHVMRSSGSITIDWNILLKPRITTLVRLDLSEMPLDSEHLGHILHASSTTCPCIRVLALPKQTARYKEDNEAREANMNELYGALQRWHCANGGLLHLRIPFGRFDENTAIRLLRALVAYCPEIQYLDGWQDTYQLNLEGQASCEVYWPAPAALWAKFWASCTQLRAFNMVMMPFDDLYLAALACGKNPKLESFVVAIDSGNARHHEVSRAVLPSMTLAWENLKYLRVEIPVVRRDVWNPVDCIGDQFMGYLAIQCPQLQELRLQCASPTVFFDIGDSGLQFLKRLVHLEVLELQRLQRAPPSLVFHLFQSWPAIRLCLSFVRGQHIAWNLMRVVADMERKRNSEITFAVSLSRIVTHGNIQSGIRKNELRKMVDLMPSGAQIHVHTMQREPSSIFLRQPEEIYSDDDDEVDLAHLELSLADRAAFGWFRQKDRFAVRESGLQPCDWNCSAPGIVESPR